MNFRNAKLVKVLIWYDGDLLDIYEQDDKLYFVLWSDIIGEEDDRRHVWHIFEATKETVEAHLVGRVSLREVMRVAPGLYVGEGMCFGPDAPDVTLVNFADILEERLPSEDSHFAESLAPDPE